jgi:carotenoid cleavage dioxygenase-like enzyme
VAKRSPMHPLARHALVDRRSFIARAAAFAAVAGTGTALVSACGTDASDGGNQAVVDGGYDPTQPYWMQGGFGPVATETEAFDLEVTGTLPPALDGLFVRNGSNPATGESHHWFLGDGMLHGLRLEAGAATWYRNRWVETPLYEQRSTFGEVPPGGDVTQSNVSVIHHGGRLLTLGEVGLPFEVSTADLSTVGAHDYGGRLATSMTAHPKVDQATGDLHFFGYGFLPPFLTYHVASADGTLRSSEEVAVAGPTMIHDFAITEHHAVFWELPVVFDLDAAIAGEDFPFRWDPGYGARIGVLPLGGPAAAVRWVEIDPCYVFHGVNAWEEEGEVVVDVCRHQSMFSGGTTGLGGAGSDLRRWRVDTSGDMLRFRDEVLEGERLLELPAIDRRRTGTPSRHSWLLETEEDPDTVVFAGLVRRDDSTGALDTWTSGAADAPGEITFVPDGDGAGEGEGWALTYSVDLARGSSDLVVLDATDLASGPVARVHLPVRVPFGFHGTWVPAAHLEA